MDENLRTRSAAWYYREHFGFNKPPPQTDLRAMAIALVTAAHGDRQISIDERNWIVGYFAAKGYPIEVVREAMGVGPAEGGKVPDILNTPSLRKSARILVYDAIRVAAVDGYREGEMKAVRDVAFSLGLTEEAVRDIEALVHDEEALRERRVAVLMPEGHDFLDPKYGR